MEAHFVHRNEAGGLAVVGVLMAEGRPNPAFGKIVRTMPAVEGPAAKADAGIDPHALLPQRLLSYYRYPGSLTTPPCSETVEWLLLTTPIQASAADVAAFAKLYPMNARPRAEGQPALRAALDLSRRLVARMEKGDSGNSFRCENPGFCFAPSGLHTVTLTAPARRRSC